MKDEKYAYHFVERHLLLALLGQARALLARRRDTTLVLLGVLLFGQTSLRCRLDDRLDLPREFHLGHVGHELSPRLVDFVRGCPHVDVLKLEAIQPHVVPDRPLRSESNEGRFLICRSRTGGHLHHRVVGHDDVVVCPCWEYC